MKWRSPKGLGEYVRRLLRGRDVGRKNMMVSEFISDKIIIYFNVFGALMKDQIRQRTEVPDHHKIKG